MAKKADKGPVAERDRGDGKRQGDPGAALLSGGAKTDAKAGAKAGKGQAGRMKDRGTGKRQGDPEEALIDQVGTKKPPER